MLLTVWEWKVSVIAKLSLSLWCVSFLFYKKFTWGFLKSDQEGGTLKTNFLLLHNSIKQDFLKMKMGRKIGESRFFGSVAMNIFNNSTYIQRRGGQNRYSELYEINVNWADGYTGCHTIRGSTRQEYLSTCLKKYNLSEKSFFFESEGIATVWIHFGAEAEKWCLKSLVTWVTRNYST